MISLILFFGCFVIAFFIITLLGGGIELFPFALPLGFILFALISIIIYGNGQYDSEACQYVFGTEAFSEPRLFPLFGGAVTCLQNVTVSEGAQMVDGLYIPKSVNNTVRYLGRINVVGVIR